jgi:hypothetical protein
MSYPSHGPQFVEVEGVVVLRPAASLDDALTHPGLYALADALPNRGIGCFVRD